MTVEKILAEMASNERIKAGGRFIVVDGANWYPEGIRHLKDLVKKKDTTIARLTAEVEDMKKREAQYELALLHNIAGDHDLPDRSRRHV